MNIIEEIFKSYERNNWHIDSKQHFFDESQEILNEYIDNKVKSLLNHSSTQLKDKHTPTFEDWAVLNGYTDVTFSKIKRGAEWFDYMKVREIYNNEIENL